LVSDHGQDSLLYGYADHQGSLIALTDESGNVLQRYAYYDPLTAQFFSPDPYVQSPDNWLNYNRYSYCLNNPLKYTDPSGENPLIIAAIIMGSVSGGINLAAHWSEINSFWDGLAAFGIGFGAGFLGTYTGGSAFVAAGGSAIGGGGFLAGFLGSRVGYTSSTIFESTGNAAYFGDPLPTADQVASGFAFSALSGGVLNGLNALSNGRNFLTGKVVPTLPVSTSQTPPINKPGSETKQTTSTKQFNANYQDKAEIQIPEKVYQYTDKDPSSWQTIGKLDASPTKPTYFAMDPELGKVSAVSDLSLDKIPNFRIDVTGEALDPDKIMIIRTVTGNVNSQGGGGWEILYNGYINKSAVIRIVHLP
jgi:RHS repeat-associated protein